MGGKKEKESEMEFIPAVEALIAGVLDLTLLLALLSTEMSEEEQKKLKEEIEKITKEEEKEGEK